MILLPRKCARIVVTVGVIEKVEVSEFEAQSARIFTTFDGLLISE
jgi:hypothetical protein